MTKLNPDAPPSTAQANQAAVNRPTYKITIYCKERQSLTTIENVRTPSFVCPLCESRMVYLPGEHRIGAHGQSSGSLKHELRKVQVMENISAVASKPSNK